MGSHGTILDPIGSIGLKGNAAEVKAKGSLLDWEGFSYLPALFVH